PFVYKSFPKRKLGGPVGGPEKAETSEVITIIIIGFGERIGDAEVAAAARIKRRLFQGKRHRRLTRLGRRINPQHLNKFRDFAEVAQRIARGFIIATKNIGKEHVFPRAAAHGTRLDLAQADVAQSEYA